MPSIQLNRESALHLESALVLTSEGFTPFRAIAWLATAAAALSLLIAAVLSLIVLGISS